MDLHGDSARNKHHDLVELGRALRHQRLALLEGAHGCLVIEALQLVGVQLGKSFAGLRAEHLIHGVDHSRALLLKLFAQHLPNSHALHGVGPGPITQ